MSHLFFFSKLFLRMLPVYLSSSVRDFYEKTTRDWIEKVNPESNEIFDLEMPRSCDLDAKDVKDSAEGLSQQKKRDIVLLSIGGGIRDIQVREEL